MIESPTIKEITKEDFNNFLVNIESFKEKLDFVIGDFSVIEQSKKEKKFFSNYYDILNKINSNSSKNGDFYNLLSKDLERIFELRIGFISLEAKLQDLKNDYVFHVFKTNIFQSVIDFLNIAEGKRFRIRNFTPEEYKKANETNNSDEYHSNCRMLKMYLNAFRDHLDLFERYFDDK